MIGEFLSININIRKNNIICEVVGTISACKISFAKDYVGADSGAYRYANSHY